MMSLDTHQACMFTCREFDLLMHRDQRKRKKSGKAQTWKVRLIVDIEGPMEVTSWGSEWGEERLMVDKRGLRR